MRPRPRVGPLTVLTAVSPGEEPGLADRLARLPAGEDSPFQRLPRFHFARFVVLDGPPGDFPGAPWPSRPLRMSYLLFTATVTGPASGAVEELRAGAGAEADDVWGACVAYPGAADARGFHAWFRRNSLRTSMWFAAYEAGVPEVREAVALRRRHVEFLIEHGRDAPAALQQAFREQFGA